ncbi:hypothetical protein, partial [Pseudomonas sp. GW456-12-1-14-TSB1]|uniref:hypothetical protein n=1 Tax=Pseudomonas sp. GW456-12-1-14-TSB1 TaxID=2751349 RepID=UPI001A9212A2
HWIAGNRIFSGNRVFICVGFIPYASGIYKIRVARRQSYLMNAFEIQVVDTPSGANNLPHELYLAFVAHQ